MDVVRLVIDPSSNEGACAAAEPVVAEGFGAAARSGDAAQTQAQGQAQGEGHGPGPKPDSRGRSVVSGEPVQAGHLPPGSGARAARRLADIAAARLADAPAAAEEQLRRALVVGFGEIGGRELAELRTRLVTAIAAQPGRDRDVARAAASAAACWYPLSAADSAHLWLVAGRAWHRAGKHVEAVTAFDRPLLSGVAGYPSGELALVRAEFAESLIRLGRHRQAAWQFTEAARLLAGSATQRHRHADLVWSAAVARECCGQESAALGGYLRAAGLWGELGKIVPRARCLRAAAWLQLRGPRGRVRGPWWVTIDVLMAELNDRLATDPGPHIADELDRTRAQFAQMCAQASGPC